MVVVGLELDHAAQQPLHLVEAVDLLGHHRLLVEQVGVVGKALVGLRRARRRPRVQCLTSRSTWLRRAAWRARRRAALGHAADQLARLRHLALARQQRGAARLHLERALRVVDLGQPGFGGLRSRRAARPPAPAAARPASGPASACRRCRRRRRRPVARPRRRRRAPRLHQLARSAAAPRRPPAGWRSSRCSAPSVSQGGASSGCCRVTVSSCATASA